MQDSSSPSEKIVPFPYQPTTSEHKSSGGGGGDNHEGRITRLEIGIANIRDTLVRLEPMIVSINSEMIKKSDLKEHYPTKLFVFLWLLIAGGALCTAYWNINPLMIENAMRQQK